MSKGAIVTFVLLLLATWAGAPREVRSGHGSQLPPELDRVLRDYERAWQAKDAGALAKLFAEDGYVLSNTKPPVHGRDAILAAYAGQGGPLWLRALSHATDGGVGYIVGVYGHEPGKPESGKFVLALRSDATGKWLIAADIDNSIATKPPGGG